METCYKAFRREVAPVDRDRGGPLRLRARDHRQGRGRRWRVYEVGISYDGRTYAEGKKIGWRDGVRAQLLYSDFDRKLGHHRRYRKAGLRSVVESAGFDVVDARYVNAPGFFSWLLITRLLKQEPTAGPLVTIFDRIVVPVVRRLESIIAPPFGQSILLIAANRARPG
jgi:hypothetical protein